MNLTLIVSSHLMALISLLTKDHPIQWIHRDIAILYLLSVLNHSFSSRKLFIRVIDYIVALFVALRTICLAYYATKYLSLYHPSVSLISVYWGTFGLIAGIFITKSHVNNTPNHVIMHVAGSIAVLCLAQVTSM